MSIFNSGGTVFDITIDILKKYDAFNQYWSGKIPMEEYSVMLDKNQDNIAVQSVYEKNGWKLSNFLSYGFKTSQIQTTKIKNKELNAGANV